MKPLALLSLLTLPFAGHTLASDTVIFSDKVITMTERRGQAQALAIAISDGTITWVGEHDAAQAHIKPATQILHFKDQAVLPGFIDAHGHIGFVGINAQLANVASPPVGPVSNIADLQNTLRAYIEARNIPNGEWVIGRGYDDSLLQEQRHPTRDELDAVSDTHPVLLMHVSGHLATANSRALARAGISAETQDPPGGHIRRRPDSREPNGVLEETAAAALRRFMMEPVKDPLLAFRDGLKQYASYGLTTAQDGASNADSIQMMRAADDAGHVFMDIVAYPFGMQDEGAMLNQFKYGAYQGRVKVAGVKLMLDGSPQGKTAYMTQPYLHPPHGQGQDYRGYPTIPQLRVDELVAHYLGARVPVIAHANGDAAADMLIRAVRAARPTHDHRTVMIHAQTVREDQLTAMKTQAIVPSFFAAHAFYWGDWHRDSVFGEARATRISPTASTVARGMWFTVHNDAPVVPPDTIRLLWATTNRLTRSSRTLGENQRISTYDALRAMTLNAAYQHFEEQHKGSIEVGKQADLVVLSADPLAMPTSDLLSLKVQATFSRGQQIYVAEADAAADTGL